MYLYLVRHGETEWNEKGLWQGTTDVPLNERGIEQAKRLAERFKKLDAVYSSPLSRSLMTAEEIAKRFQLEVRVEEGLRECEISLWNGLTVEEVLVRFPREFTEWSKNPHFETIGLESLANVQKRMVNSVLKIVANERLSGSEHVVIVSHAISLRTFICWVLGLPLQLHTNFKLDNASLSIVEFKSKPRVLLLNDTCHLED